MKGAKKHFSRALTLLLSVLIMLQTVTVPAFAAENATENSDNAAIVNFMEWTPSQSGTYDFLAFVTDATGKRISYAIYKGDTLYYTLSGSIFDYLEWSPTEAGDYTIVVCVTDKTGFKATYSKQFSII